MKAYVEYGAQDAAEILNTIKNNPSLLKQTDKTLIEIVQEVGNGFKVRQGYRPPEPHSSTPMGKKGWDLKGLDGKNKPAIIYGRKYSGHAIDKIQERGLTPLAVENTIKIGQITPDPKPGRLRHYDIINHITVITDQQTGNVISVFFGER